MQVGALVCEEAPQELRSRMWMALLEDSTLCGSLLDEKASAHGFIACHPAAMSCLSLLMTLKYIRAIINGISAMQALEEELSLAAGSQRSMRSNSFTSADGMSTRSQGSMARQTSSNPTQNIGMFH